MQFLIGCVFEVEVAELKVFDNCLITLFSSFLPPPPVKGTSCYSSSVYHCVHEPVFLAQGTSLTSTICVIHSTWSDSILWALFNCCCYVDVAGA